MPSFIKIDGVHNFRDFGGYKNIQGAKIKSGVLFRSGQFSGISEGGLKALKKISPQTIIDLRKANERAKQTSYFGELKLKKIENDFLSVDKDSLPQHLKFLQEQDRSFVEVFKYMIESTRKIPFEPDHKIIFSKALKELAASNLPIIIHCTAGKDRTGILCAMIHEILEVDKETILDDYLHTNKVPGHEEIIIKYAQYSTEMTGRHISPEIMRPMGQVHKDFVLAAFDEINNKFENLNNYLAHIGIFQEDIEKIRSNLLL